MSEITWSEAAPSVLHFAENLIDNFHPHLKDARIAFVFRSEAQKQGDRLILGQCSKVPSKMQPYLEFDYLIWLSEADYTAMSNLQREALIDHELCHCKRNMKTGAWGIRQHDIQEFSAVIKRHGIWSPDIRRVKDAIDDYQTVTLPNMMLGEFSDDSRGKIISISGSQLEQAAKALGE